MSAITLAVAQMLGIGRVYRIGGPPAVAALAYGTQTVEPVNFIAGPGHPVVQTAKLRVAGVVGVDGFYGACEIVTVADEAADPQRVASDLIAQAEHNPGKCFLVAWDRGVIERIEEAVSLQLPMRQRREPVERSLRSESFALLVAGEAEACA
ncbi:MAG: histidinol dehydrogenase, partial [Oceanicaulis sp.]